MEQVVGQIKIDFQIIESKNPKYLTIGDTSQWVYAKNKPSYISITLPGSKKAITHTLKKDAINNFNSHNLGLSCLSGDCGKETYIELPDGIYTLCLKSGFEGIEEKKFYLKTDRIDLEFAKVVVKNSLEYSKNDKAFIEDILNIEWLLRVAKSHAYLGDFVKADRFFEESRRLLRKYVDCKDCL